MGPTAPLARGLVALLAASLVVGGVAGVAGGVVDGASATLQVAEPTPANGTTRHEDPRAVAADGDLAAVRGWLAERMAVRLEDCVIAVGAGTTDVCAFEDEYPGWLGKYVDVADDTREETDDRLGRTFERAAEDADGFASSVGEFRRTHRAYRTAREAGDEDRARTLARRLQRQGAAVEGRGGDLVGTFLALEGGADVDLAAARRSVNATRENVTAVVREVEREQFVATTLTAELAPRTISFLVPGTVTGRLATENGSPVADRRIELRVGERDLVARTDGAGEFSLAYRPTTLPLSTEELTVRYAPRNASAYLGSETTVPVTVTPVRPDVAVDVSPATVRFADGVRVNGQVAAGGVGAPGVPVVVSLDGRRLGRVPTDGSGTFALTAPVEAVDGPGAVEVRADMPLAGRALASADGSASVRVEPTGTSLSLDASAGGPATVAVEGALRTAGGLAVPGQPVAVRVNGTAVESLRTGADGSFRGTATLPSALRSDAAPGVVRVAVVYAGRGTNLEPSNASAAVTLPVEGAGSAGAAPEGVLSRPVDAVPGAPRLWQLLALVGLAVLAALGALRWRRGRRPAGVGTAEPAAGSDAAGSSRAPDPSPTPDGPTSALEPARSRLAADPDAAVMLAYAAVRGALSAGDGPGRRRADTHWEFVAACREDGVDDAAVAALTALTEAYERAAYAPSATSTADAESALEAADGLV